MSYSASAPAPVEDPCATDAAPSDHLLGLRIGALFAILFVSCIGVAVPYVAQSPRPGPTFFVLRAVAGGVVLITGFVHVLGDAFPLLTDPCLGLSSTYPWACAFAGLAVLLTFTLEFGLNRAFQAWAAREVAASRAAAAENDDSEAAKQEAEKSLQRRRYIAASITFEAGIIFHSIFIGITLGITSSVDTARALAIALCFHQGFEGLALGTTMIKAQYSWLKYTLCAILFVLITPIGIAIGTAVGASYQTESKLALGFEGGFDSVLAGMLIYNAIADIILPTFSDEEIPPQWWLQLLGLFGLYVGGTIMGLIGKWA